MTDIEHSPNYITFGLPQTHEMRFNQSAATLQRGKNPIMSVLHMILNSLMVRSK